MAILKKYLQGFQNCFNLSRLSYSGNSQPPEILIGSVKHTGLKRPCQFSALTGHNQSLTPYWLGSRFCVTTPATCFSRRRENDYSESKARKANYEIRCPEIPFPA